MTTERRIEELLLELIRERLLAYKPRSEAEAKADDERDAKEGYPPTPEELARRRGYNEGWWECYEALRNITRFHNEGNAFRL